jgi:myo-inositol catabolism protein IolS
MAIYSGWSLIRLVKESLMGQFRQFASLPLGFGGASLSGEGGGYGFGSISEADAISLVHEALELGVKVFDTAPIYGFGTSEERLGKALKGRREQAYVISKSGVHWHSTKRVNMTNDPLITQEMLEASLKRLKTDWIDLYMIHWPDEHVDIRRPMEVLARALDQGLIRGIGLCNTNPRDLDRAQEIAPIVACQNQLNVFERGVVHELLPRLLQEDISFMSWGTLDKGILTGRVTKERTFGPEDCRSWAPWWKAMDFEARYRILDALTPWLKRHGLSNLELAIGHNLAIEGVELVLAGPKNSEQLRGLVQNARPLSAAQYLELEAMLVDI